MRYQFQTGHRTPPNIVRELRALVPAHQLRRDEALAVAELQANRLLALTGHRLSQPVPIEVVTQLPHVELHHDPSLPIAGASYWDHRSRTWVIRLSPTVSAARRRFRLLHEFKHILDYRPTPLPGATRPRHGDDRTTELAADHFAASVLLPKRAVRAAYAEGLSDPAVLAARFETPEAVVRVRLRQLGLTTTEPTEVTA